MWRAWRSWIFYPLLWLVCMVVPLGIQSWYHQSGDASTTAADNNVTITRFDATYRAERVGDDLTLAVTERIQAKFLYSYTNHGILRRLNMSYNNTDLGVSHITVADAEGRPMPFEQRLDSSSQHLVLRIGDPATYVDGPMTYVISYRIQHAMIGHLSGAQEVYLDVNGTGWPEQINETSATLIVPNDLAGQLTGNASCYQGSAGSTDHCVIQRHGNNFSAQIVGLDPHQTMTIAVGFQPGTVAHTVAAPHNRPGTMWLILSLPGFGLLTLGVALVMRRRSRRQVLPANAPIQFTAPDVPAVMAADFVGEPDRGAAAELAQLVLQGHAQILSVSEATGTSPQSRTHLDAGERKALDADLRVMILDPKAITSNNLREFATSLFGAGTPRALDAASPTEVERATERRRELLDGEYLRKHSSLPQGLFAVGYLVLLIGGWVLLAYLNALQGFMVLGGLMAVLLLVAAASLCPTQGGLTTKGKEFADRLGGLRRFMAMAEAERISWMQNAVDAPRITNRDAAGHQSSESASRVKIYEPLLPFAIIFGMESTWSQLLGDLRVQTSAVPAAPRLASVQLAAFTAHQSTWSRGYYQRRYHDTTWWDTRPAFGSGAISTSMNSAFDSARSRRDDDGDSGGSWWRSSGSGGGGSSWSSFSSGDSGSASSGGGSAGGGMGGGGGGGW